MVARIGDTCDLRDDADSLVVFDGIYDRTALDWAKAGDSGSLAGGKLRQTMTGSTSFIGPTTRIAKLYADYAFAPLSIGPAVTIPTSFQGGGRRSATSRASCSSGATTPARSLEPEQCDGVGEHQRRQQQLAEELGHDLVANQTSHRENMATQNRCNFWQGIVADTDSESLGATCVDVEIDYVFLVAIGS